MAQLAQGLCLNLAYPLPCHIKLLSHFLQGPGTSVVQAESKAQHLLFPLCQCQQNFHQLFMEKGEGCRVLRHQHIVILYKVSQMAVLLLADGRL